MSPCQFHEGHMKANGYGYVRLGGKNVYAHRLAWALHDGADPAGMVVMHSCDNPACINPEHLSLGTHADNVHDKVLKGRQPRSLGHYATKIDQAKADEIRGRRASGESGRALACAFGVSEQLVCDIHKGRKW